jgi:hypothetical protein
MARPHSFPNCLKVVHQALRGGGGDGGGTQGSSAWNPCGYRVDPNHFGVGVNVANAGIGGEVNGRGFDSSTSHLTLSPFCH